MPDYNQFFLSSPASTVQLETLEISHPSFTQTYRVVRNSIDGITATLENGSSATFAYYPLQIESVGLREDLDYGLSINLGDLGEVLPTELDRVSSDDAFDVKPSVIYRTFRSDDLSSPLFGPLTLEVTAFSFNREGSTFEAMAPSLNINGTGEVYSIDRFPMLRSFV
jgi:hypothetical protein